MTQMVEKAIIIGATGLVGLTLIQRLNTLPSCRRITAVVRAQNPILHQFEKVQQLVVEDFLLLNAQDVADYSHAFSCLGTTLKKAKSKAGFYQVDFAINAHFADLLLSSNTHYVLVSALGASVDAQFFYQRVKGELESYIRSLSLFKVSIIRPSLLLDQRIETRFLENLTKYLYAKMVALVPVSLKYRPVTAQQVVQTIIYAAQNQDAEYVVYDNSAIIELNH
ncbi:MULTISPECIES: nucleoside-diphosphate sugar epimerase [unclassified Acinetobacter]|uniref:nucleoside-diphosphate sugar epimerase n=1 Tax=unclassified Acinetobacter TaxID=196816 RepID=UPI0029344AA5|nr:MULTISPECIES: nucleoside-diphosphate sugar epimerase [unclassified Acinetobacter]WOE32080.1 nucleoside-diphosphate sugar epimerase [Acinetobacter sp. SAAs470]WOE37549.1 nucleoside-diphosphate sugar epimerase [Acinetobacter sp. SAAs474]